MITDFEYVRLLGFERDSEQAKIAISFRNALGQYGGVSPLSIDPRVTIYKLGIVIPEDSLDLVDFTVMYAEQEGIEMNEEAISLFLSVQEGNKLVGHWVKEVISYGASSNC